MTTYGCCCRIQAAQAAAAPATAATNSMEAQPPLSETAPPLPPLPPDEDSHPPPLPPPPPAEPPFVPAAPGAPPHSALRTGHAPPAPPGASTHSALRTGHASLQSTWQQPAHPSSQQQATLQQASSSSGQAPHCSVFSGHNYGAFSAVPVKTEVLPAAASEAVPGAVKVEDVGTTGRSAQLSSGQQPTRAAGGAIQFGFGGSKSAGKVSVCMT